MRGLEIIQQAVKDLPSNSGVYRMVDEKDGVLYVGKAKNLKKRVVSYTKTDLPTRLQRMVFLTKRLEYTITKTEAEALLLEASLIKRYQPRFNILLKDDKSFPYIKIRTDHEYPQLMKFRGKNLENGKYFGPFASSYDVDHTISMLQKIFKLRPCTDPYFESRKRPCLQYQIKRCSAPCVRKILPEEYNGLLKEAISFLSGKNLELQKDLANKMQSYSENFEYEKAAEIRDRIKALSYVQLKAGIADTGVKDADVIAIAHKSVSFCIQVFLYRGGQSYGSKAFFPIHTEDSTSKEVLSSFIGLFYQNRPTPSEIITNIELDEADDLCQALSQLHQTKVAITTPKRGPKIKLIEHAYDNAVEALNSHLKNASKNLEMLQQVQDLFKLPELPDRIEIYDNSHIMGQFAVGAMVVATKDGFDKNEYRRFTIKTTGNKPNITGGDDYQMLREVMQRRLTRLSKEPERIPSLMIIDGGVGHMNVVKKVMEDFAITLPFICMAKGVDRNSGRETFHQVNKEAFTIDRDEPVMRYLQILRDEAHNYVIRSHRQKRSSALKASSLDNIIGIGENRKKALLNYFGSFEAIKQATIEDLTKIEGISKALATKIHHQLNF